MDIKNFDTKQEYNLEPKPTTESVVSHINEGNQVKFDGVNVEVNIPRVGDAVYHDGSKVRFYNQNNLNNLLLTSAGLTPVGACGGLIDGKVLIIDGEEADKKYADVVQFTISAISATNITFYLKMAGDYANFAQIDVTLTSAEINATSAAEINAALEAAGNAGNVGYDKHKYWAYLADDNGNKVESGGTKIIVQCDSWMDYRQYQCSDGSHALVGLTMTHTVWGDMPENSNAGFRINGRSGNEHIMNVAKGVARYGTNGRTPSANVPLNEAAGIVKKADFETSAYCALLRQTYGTYEEYIRREYTLMYPQKLGAFRMPRAKVLSAKYSMMTAPVKDGSTKYKFSAMNYAATKNYNVAGIALGDWFLHGVHEGTMMMLDENMAKINATFTKMNKTLISNSSPRWFAQRYYVNSAWLYYGSNGNLDGSYVHYAFKARAVALLDIKN